MSSTFPLCSQMQVVFYHWQCNTRLRLLYLLGRWHIFGELRRNNHALELLIVRPYGVSHSNQEENNQKEKKTTAVKFQIPFSGFSLPKLIWRRLSSAWFGGVVPTKKRGYFELYLHQFKQNAQLSRFLFGLKWEQLTVCLNPNNSLLHKLSHTPR